MEPTPQESAPQITTEFVRDAEGFIQLSEPVTGLVTSEKHFYFQTRTIIPIAGGKPVAVRSTRAMALGLLKYFIANRPFQDRILRENEAHALRHFTNRCPQENSPKSSVTS